MTRDPTASAQTVRPVENDGERTRPDSATISGRLARAETAVATGDLKQVLELVLEEVWSDGRWLPLAETCYHPDMVVHTISLPVPSRKGREEVRELHTMLRTAYPDLQMKPEQMVREGDLVAARCTLSGTHRGEFRGFPPTGKRMKVAELGIWRFENGRVKEIWIAPDVSGQLRQLGLIPSGPPPKSVMFLLRLIQRFKAREPGIDGP